MAGGGVWVCSVTLTWFLVWVETQEPGLRLVTARRVTTWSGDLSATFLTRFHKWAGGVLLGNHPLPGERGGKWSCDARYTTLLLLRPKDWGNCSFIDVLGTAGYWASGKKKKNSNSTLTSCLGTVCHLSSRLGHATLSAPGYLMFFASITLFSGLQRWNGTNRKIAPPSVLMSPLLNDLLPQQNTSDSCTVYTLSFVLFLPLVYQL